jgi:hypothetical protein
MQQCLTFFFCCGCILQRADEKGNLDLVKKRFVEIYEPLFRLPPASCSTFTRHTGGGKGPSSQEINSAVDAQIEDDSADDALHDIDSKIRVLYLICLQILVKINPKAFHSEWTLLLGDGRQHQENGKMFPLSYILKHDTSTQVRHAVAVSISTLIEGPAQRAYLRIGEKPTASIKSFIRLSDVIGDMIIGNIQSLNACILSETSDIVCCALVRALNTFLVGCSWDKIPQEYFWASVSTLHKKLLRLVPDVEAANHTVLFSCLNSLSSILSAVKMESTPLTEEKIGTWLTNIGDNGQGHTAMETVVYWYKQGRIKVKIEALAALRGLLRFQCHTSSFDSLCLWLIQDAQPRLASQGSSKTDAQKRAMQERLQQQIVQLFGDIIRLEKSCDSRVISRIYGSILLPAATHQQSPRIRAASFSAISQSPRCPEDPRLYSTILKSCLDDTDSTVRSSATRAFCTYVEAQDDDATCSFILQWREDIVHVLEKGFRDSILAVRIPCSHLLEIVSKHLWYSTVEQLGQWKTDVDTLSDLCDSLSSFIYQACMDHDKVKVESIHALGYLVGIRCRISSSSSSLEDSRSLETLDTCFDSGCKAVQWAACEASRIILLTAQLTQSLSTARLVTMLCEKRGGIQDSTSRTRLLIDEALVSFGYEQIRTEDTENPA